MCQSILTTYKFCGCTGSSYDQICPKPTATCKLLLHNPTTLQLTCYCDKHSSQTFKTVRQNDRDTARFNMEYNKILAKEEEQQQQRQANRGRQTARLQADQRPARGRPSRERSLAAKEREQQIFIEDRNASIVREKREIAGFREREREMEAYGRKWGRWAMRRKYSIARERKEEERLRREKEREIERTARQLEEGGGGCVVM
jgi:hypothetical protein